MPLIYTCIFSSFEQIKSRGQKTDEKADAEILENKRKTNKKQTKKAKQGKKGRSQKMKIRRKRRGRVTLMGRVSIALMGLALTVCAILGLYDFLIPETVSCFSEQAFPSYLGATFEGEERTATVGQVVSVGAGQYKLFGKIPVKQVTAASIKDIKVYAGGFPFGIKFFTKGVLVVGFDDEGTNPAFAAGLRLHDVITHVDGKAIVGTNDFNEKIDKSGGREVYVTYLRAGKEGKVRFCPKYLQSEGKYSCGIWLKDSGAGIGTVTFVVPDSYVFGGLGHGICDGDTGELIEMESGNVVGVTINGVVRGQSGAPGELKGYFNSSGSGALLKNSECGVFGVLGAIPESVKSEPLPIGLKSELREGRATVLCTLDDNVRREYEIEISDINRNATGNKCFSVKITDKDLVAASGGIVQGMSGSPIIQNGKLVGAITHVLINDPSRGYGIFIENMLTAAESSDGAGQSAA